MSLFALTRAVSPAMAACELTHLARTPIDVERAAGQHAAYEQALADLGCRVQRLSSDATIPDSVFIEDTAIVLDELAVILRPGAPSRLAEVPQVASALGTYRTLARMEPPGTMDGGDVLLIGRTLFTGRSTRTNDAGIEQVRGFLLPYGYTIRPVDVRGCLHLKSAATAVSDHTILVNREWIDVAQLAPFGLVDVDSGEPGAANVVQVGGRLLAAAAFPRTRERLERLGLPVTSVDVSEIAKAEGAVTCCSLIFTVR